MKKYLKAQNLIPIIHFILSFFYERLVFNFSNNFEIQTLIPISNRFSDLFEMVMAYIISKLIGLVLIVLLWKLVFAIFEKKIKVKTSILFTSIFLLGCVILLILFPESLMMAEDNYITYAQAVNFIPGYWHSIYTSCFYAGCMMVLPTPFMIVFFHYLGLVYGVGYIYERIGNSKVIPGGFRFLIFIIFLLPYTYIMLMDAYRSELYCVLCLIYSGIVILDIIERKDRNVHDTLPLLLLSAVISIWRSEGIILGFGSFIILVLFVHSGTIFKKLYKLGLCLFIMLILILPQKVGDIKYYGNDYKIVNITYPLGHIFNDKSANLTYAGAEDDIKNIEAFMPVSYLKEYYLDGYRRRNVAIGSRDINQSISASQYSDAFVSSGYRIILHNIKPYLINQWNFLNIAFETHYFITQPAYDGEPNNAIPWTYTLWDEGRRIFNETAGVEAWINWEARKQLETAMLEKRENILSVFYESWGESSLDTIKAINIFSFVSLLILALYETVRWFVKRNIRDSFPLFLWLLLAQFIGIFLFMPSGMPTYFRGAFFVTYAVLLTYPARISVCKALNKACIEEK